MLIGTPLPALLITLNDVPVKLNVTAVPTLTPIIISLGAVTVAKPLPPVAETAPSKLIDVIDVPTEVSKARTSTPEITPVNKLPSPTKLVDVVTPVTTTPLGFA